MSKQAEIFYCNYEFEDTPVNGVEQMTEDQLIELMEAYHQSRVNAISDEDIENISKMYLKKGNTQYGFKKGTEWFKNKLLKQ
jgi:hypothetical protein